MYNLALFASHNGSLFDPIYEATLQEKIFFQIALVISNNPNAPILAKAKEHNIPHFVINNTLYNKPDDAIDQLLKEYHCTHALLAGYLRMIPKSLTQKYFFINSHPSLLPHHGGKGMYGHFVHEAVIAAHEQKSGVTIHKVNEKYDDGEILLQKEMLLEKNETPQTLETKIKALEKIAIIEALALHQFKN